MALAADETAVGTAFRAAEAVEAAFVKDMHIACMYRRLPQLATYCPSLATAVCLSNNHVVVTLPNLLCCCTFQVFAQPVFENIESFMTENQVWPSKQPWLMRAIVRSLYVAFTTFVACLIPFFADLMGLIGAAGFTPLTFIFPCIFWLKVRTATSPFGSVSLECQDHACRLLAHLQVDVRHCPACMFVICIVGICPYCATDAL